MQVGVGLPASVPGVEGRRLLGWARHAEQLRFSTLAVLDRLVYSNFESLVTLSAAAAVTEHIRLAATILIAPYRANAALLAKQIATVDQISGGRLTVGVSAGGREDDFVASGVRYAGRGRTLDAMLATMERIWSGDDLGLDRPIGPAPIGRPPMLIGGHSDGAMRRAARYGTGWIAGGSSASAYAELVGRMLDVWHGHGRTGRPRMTALSYFALGPDAVELSRAYLKRYYAFMGPAADRIAGRALTDPETIRQTIRDYRQAGCDELILFPCAADLNQLDLLAEVVAPVTVGASVPASLADQPLS